MFVHAHSQLSLFILSVYSVQFQENYSEVSGTVCLVSNMTKGFGNWFPTLQAEQAIQSLRVS